MSPNPGTSDRTRTLQLGEQLDKRLLREQGYNYGTVVRNVMTFQKQQQPTDIIIATLANRAFVA